MTEPHPDDESLSAALDGEDSPAATHVAGCPPCRARLDTLGAARRAVAADPAAGAPPGLADRALAAALAAYTAERAASPHSSTPATPTGEDRVVVPLRPAAGAVTSPGTSSPAWRRRAPGWALGVAAALAAILVAVPVLTRDTDGDDRQVAARVSGSNGTAPAPSAGALAPVVDGGDLGDQSDQLALGGVLADAVAGSGGPPPVPTAGDSPAAGSGGAQAKGALEGSPAPVIASTSPERSTNDSGPAVAADDTAADAVTTAACESTVQSDFAQGLGPLLYRATLRWQGTPSVLLAYRLADTSGNGPDHRGFVMALEGCQLLVVQGF